MLFSLFLICVCVWTGYGFVDFDSPAAAQKAVASLKASGVQAQMAKVSVAPICRRFTSCFSCRQGVSLQRRLCCLAQLPWLQACRGG